MKNFSLDDLFDDAPKSDSTTAVLQTGEPAPEEELQPINVLADSNSNIDDDDDYDDADDDDIDDDNDDETETENLAGVTVPDPPAKELNAEEKREKLISEIFEQNDYIRTCEGEVESAKETLKDAKDQLEKATSRLRVLVKSLQNFSEKENLPLFDGIDDSKENPESPVVAESVVDSPVDSVDAPAESCDAATEIKSTLATTEQAVTYSDFSDDSQVETLQSILGCSDSQIAKFNAKGYHTLEDLIVALKHDDEQENIDVLTQVEGVGKAKAKKYLEIILERKAAAESK